ncbi:MAG: NADPH-dependent FMN reductase [uncultured bacterium]|nr:MAG: NADPH-dependent FMN reductase [uncultured bacterium]
MRDFLLGHTDNTGKTEMAQKYLEIIKRADALVIVSPEYNHGYPGELKILLDMGYKEYANKPVGFCGVSIGPFGGVRVVEQLRQIVIELHMIPVREAVYFSNISALFSEAGEITDKSYADRAKTFLTDLSSKVR